jgi:hypothetical protein
MPPGPLIMHHVPSPANPVGVPGSPTQSDRTLFATIMATTKTTQSHNSHVHRNYNSSGIIRRFNVSYLTTVMDPSRGLSWVERGLQTGTS